MFKKIFVVLFMLLSVKAYAGADDLLFLDYKTATIQDVYRALGNGAYVNIKSKKYGFTPLIYAVVKDNLDVVKVLVDAGADLNMQDKTGWTTLMFAVGKDNPDMVKVLVDAGADLNMQDKKWVHTLNGCSS